MEASDEAEAIVSEEDFNGTATLHVVAASADEAERAALRYFEETHGTRPSTAAVEAEEARDDAFTVMVADHSSGSLAASQTYDF